MQIACLQTEMLAIPLITLNTSLEFLTAVLIERYLVMNAAPKLISMANVFIISYLAI